MQKSDDQDSDIDVWQVQYADELRVFEDLQPGAGREPASVWNDDTEMMSEMVNECMDEGGVGWECRGEAGVAFCCSA